MHSVLFYFTVQSASLKSTSNVGKITTVILKSKETHIWKPVLNIKAKMTGTNGALCKLIWFHKASAVFYSRMNAW